MLRGQFSLEIHMLLFPRRTPCCAIASAVGGINPAGMK